MIEVLSQHRAQLGECPLWDGRGGYIYWIDIDGCSIHRIRLADGSEEERGTDGRPGSMTLTVDDDVLLLAKEHEVGWFSWSDGGFTPWLVLEDPDSDNRLNDGRCDPAGRYWVGSMHHMAADNLMTGFLHRVEPGGSHVTTRSGVGVANGTGFSPDGDVMYFADTLRDTVWRYDYDPDSGEAGNEKVFSSFEGLPGRPDGAAVDAEGGYWIACVSGWSVARLTPGGEVDRIIELPVEKPTMPAFGGDDLSTLFVTSIGGGASHEYAADQPEAGHLLAIDAGVAGLPEPSFAGRPHG